MIYLSICLFVCLFVCLLIYLFRNYPHLKAGMYHSRTRSPLRDIVTTLRIKIKYKLILKPNNYKLSPCELGDLYDKPTYTNEHLRCQKHWLACQSKTVLNRS